MAVTKVSFLSSEVLSEEIRKMGVRSSQSNSYNFVYCRGK